MPYVPTNVSIFVAAYSGIMSGMVASGRFPVDTVSGDYTGNANVAGAFAQAYDTVWANAAAANSLDLELTYLMCKGAWEGRLANSDATHLNAATYTAESQAIIAAITAADAFFAASGIVPPTPATGTSVTGTGLWHNTAGALDAAAIHGAQAGQVPVTNAGATDCPFAFIFGAWTATKTHADTPFTPTAAQICVACDTSGGALTVNTPLAQDGVSLPVDGQIFGVKPFVASATPINVAANGAGVTIEDPSNACSFGANGVVPGQGGGVFWKFRASDNKWAIMSNI